jgi:predicted ATPase
MTERVTAGRIRTPDQRLRVFISSTLGELAEERRAARAAFEQLRLTPVMLELGARPHPPRALYRSYLEQSDVFVGIYWQRYGWVAPDMDISGLEDEYVLSDGMPRLVYVKRPAPQIEPRLGELLDRLQVEDTASYKPFADAAELQRLIVDDLALMLTERFDAIPEQRNPRAGSSNLPTPASALIGREAELATLADLLADDSHRLVTLTGPGGTGKTRLALQTAADQVGRFPDGVHFVDLSSAREENDVFTTLASTLDVSLSGGTSPLEPLREHLQPASMLLLFDNFEQVVGAAKGLVELLESCPHLRMLVTSRVALRVRVEQLVPVPPLTLPPLGPSAITAAVALQSEAVRLFAERASALRPDFEVTDQNAPDIVAICSRLDGLPLAIELAAARVNLLGLAEIRARLEEKLDLLVSRARDVPERQRTIRNTIEWSTELLTRSERGVLDLFCLFEGGRLTDIERVADEISRLRDTSVIDELASLLDRSLVHSVAGADGHPRFTMLSTIQAYVREQLDTQPEVVEAIRAAHAAHYTQRATGLREQLADRDRAEVLAEFAEELGNLRAAWQHWVLRRDVTRLNDMLEPLWGYYDARADYRSAVELGTDLLDVLASLPRSEERDRDQIEVEMSIARSLLAVSGFTQETEDAFRAVLDRAGPAGSTRERFAPLRCLATLHMLRADFESVAVVSKELLAIAEHEQDPYMLSEAHLVESMNQLWQVDLRDAVAEVAKSTSYLDATTSGFVRLRVGPNPTVVSRAVQGLLLWMTGSPDQGSAKVEHALALAHQIDHPYSLAYALWHATLLDLWQLDVDMLPRRADALLHVAEMHDYPVWRALAYVVRGLTQVIGGDEGKGLSALEQGFTLYQGATAPPIFWPALVMIRAKAYGVAQRHADALAFIEEAERLVRPGDPVRADIALTHGDLLLSSEEHAPAEAEPYFEHAAEVAQGIGARMMQLQALTRLMTLRRGTPREGEARDQLHALLDTFTEGFTTPHLIQALTALGEAPPGSR